MSLRIYPTPESCGCPVPGNVQAQAGHGSEHPVLVEDVLANQEGWIRWPLQIPSNPNCSGIPWCFSDRLWQLLMGSFLLLSAAVLVALQLNEVKTSFDVFKQWLYSRLTVFLHHFWCSRLGDFKYNSLANCAVGNSVKVFFCQCIYRVIFICC